MSFGALRWATRPSAAVIVSLAAAASPTSPLAGPFHGKMILAPLTRGGNLPYRRLCADFGAEVTFGEMVFARALLKGDRVEKTRLRRAANEKFFGVQIATNDVEEGRRAAELAAESGADFIDLNCGCPIYEATRRNLGSALLRKPERLAAIVEGVAGGSPLPVSVKVRTAAEGGAVNVREVADRLRDAGAAAVTVHGRTATDRYSKAADWSLIAQVVADGAARGCAIPVVGNGDVLTHWDAAARLATSGVDAVMVGRGALIKPWIFGEFAARQAWEPSAAERVAIYRRLAAYMREHFGDDARGRGKAWNFLPWHMDFLSRYRHTPGGGAALADGHALLQTRADELPADAPPLERLLAHRAAAVHEQVAARLWEAASDADATLALTQLAEGGALLERAEAAAAAAAAAATTSAAEDGELANIPSDAGKGGRRRRGRTPAPQRSPEEIAELRAVRAAKRALTGASPHDHTTARR